LTGTASYGQHRPVPAVEVGDVELFYELPREVDEPGGVARQLAAILAAPDRTEALSSLRVPVLVIHGQEDVLGHDLPPEVWRQVTSAISEDAGIGAFG
jgi:pimeloyl-ACP methyl ester carboxylesterase